jgi:hypothetical protein
MWFARRMMRKVVKASSALRSPGGLPRFNRGCASGPLPLTSQLASLVTQVLDGPGIEELVGSLPHLVP